MDDKDEDDVSSPEKKLPTQQVLDFISSIKTREKEFADGWWKKAKIATDIYSVSKTSEEMEPYNILYSNTEVLLPSLYSATPKPDIRPRFKGADVGPLPTLLERYLTIAADPGQPGSESFDQAMSDAVLSALVPGSGYVRIRYSKNASFPITYESGHYETLIWGKASRWSKVPWIAFKHPMKKDQMVKQFDLELEEVQAKYKPDDASEDEKDDCCVYELWDKATRKVYYLCEEWTDKCIREVDDPLGLAGFFPTPGPLMMTAKPSKFIPTPLYEYYKNQAEELNRVTTRLNKVLAAIRVRGAYSGLLGEDMAKLLTDTAMENGLIQAGEAALLAQSGGFDKLIWMLPIEKFIVVAQELYKAREAIKQVIYEITGMSDIIRGATVASETATAQGLKDKWGTVRLRKMQALVANYARDLFRLTVDCSSEHVPPEKWLEITQLPFPTQQQQMIAKQQLQYQAQQIAQQQQMAQMQPQQPGMPPQQPPQPPDPQLVQAAQSPTIESLLAQIKSDANRTYVVNIQTSSTIDLDSAQDKNDITEFMNAMGQLLGGAQTLLSLGPTGLEAFKMMLTGISQRFKFGQDMGATFQKMQMPPPQPPEGAEVKGPTPEEQAAVKAQAELDMAKISSEKMLLQARTELEMEKLKTEKAKLAISIEEAQLSLQKKRVTLAAKPEGNPSARVPA